MPERVTFLGEPPASAEADIAYDEDRTDDGYVDNVTRLWCWRPDVYTAFATLRASLNDGSELTDRERALLVTAAAAELDDSYCSLAWGARLARLTGDATAADVIAGVTSALSDREAAIAAWARQVVRDPNGTTDDDIARLRAVGLTDREIFEATVFVAFRLAFSTINDALGAAPDKQLADAAPPLVRDAVSYGRSPAASPSLPVRRTAAGISPPAAAPRNPRSRVRRRAEASGRRPTPRSRSTRHRAAARTPRWRS
jgi:uncharacterized peroxidase-related enzyme